MIFGRASALQDDAVHILVSSLSFLKCHMVRCSAQTVSKTKREVKGGVRGGMWHLEPWNSFHFEIILIFVSF